MDYIGLTNKFPVNRVLYNEERRYHLAQDRPSRSEPHYQLSVIRMNSTYLECVDKYFAGKGFLTVMTLALGIGLQVLILGFLLYAVIDRWSEQDRSFWVLSFIGFAVVLLPIIYFIFKLLLKKECFTYTHFPIRFNRKTRKVHVFRQDGTIMTEDWDKLYFCLCETQWDNHEVRAHRLAEDGKTVLETFALPHYAPIDDRCDSPTIWSQWEFVRRYMENGPEKLVAQVDHVMDIADKRETFWHGFWRQHVEMAPILPLAILMIPLHLLYTCGRMLANYTSKIPRWPADIEAECQIDPDDPYIVDAQRLKQELKKWRNAQEAGEKRADSSAIEEQP